ncbi:hypothetical protein [Okeania sp. SIO2C2]|uniref:hypothetical protein n=1 Tax=Okeania sp. SIO2C2 TaxID=2607787 RepID=UPI00257E2846|nr:hypothetical protein [Okeania sp. SIO2C2]
MTKRKWNTKRDKCLLQIVEVRKKEEGRRKKEEEGRRRKKWKKGKNNRYKYLK